MINDVLDEGSSNQLRGGSGVENFTAYEKSSVKDTPSLPPILSLFSLSGVNEFRLFFVCEKHEHPEEAVLREVKEEVGLDGEIRGFLGHYMFKKMNQLIIAYHIYADGEVVLDDPEIDEVKILPFEKVKTWPTGTGMALKKFLQSKGYEPEEVSFG